MTTLKELQELKDALADSLDLHTEALKGMREGKETPNKEEAFAITLSLTQAASQAVLIAQGDRQIELLEKILTETKNKPYTGPG